MAVTDRVVSPERIAAILATQVGESGGAHWLERVSFTVREHWYERVDGDGYQLWLLSWLPGQCTGFHDHGGSAGAFRVLTGALQEYTPAAGGDVKVRSLGPGDQRSFGASYVHDVRNTSQAPAVSLHAYAPRLSVMNRYQIGTDGPVLVRSDREGDW